MNDNDEMREDPLLKTYLREAVEALRERVEDREADAALQGLPEPDGLALARAALAFWERLAGMEIPLPTDAKSCVPALNWVGIGERSLSRRDSNQEWKLEGIVPAERAEYEALLALATALECRRRNEVQQ